MTKHQARHLQRTALLVEDIIQRYDLKPIRNRQVQKKHVKKVLKQLERFLCRGKEKILAESILFATTHNLRWLYSRIQNDKLELHLYELKEEAAA